jgi:glycosyltransferase involved in cell wall biosynthesis
MRIAIVNWSRRRVGGVETYLNTIIPELSRAGHEIGFWHEVDEPVDRGQIGLPDETSAWCVAAVGVERALAALRDWQPSVIYTHKLSDPELERQVLNLAPSVFFAHDYNGTCISGDKTFKYPTVRPCSRRFGWQCLMHYFPHRCGGLSPITMFKLYDVQTRRLENLHRYDAIVTHSDHMLSELIKHGLSPQHAYNFPYYVQPAHAREVLSGQLARPDAAASLIAEASEGEIVLPKKRGNANWHLLFSGRMEYLKGGHVFIDALPEVAAALDNPLHVTFAGDGRERQAWERRAARQQNRKLNFDFIGWVDRSRIEELLETCDLLVVPSLWPEPFGLVGPEAGLFSVPVAAFDVGGIPDWLVDGVNGYLASGGPPTSAGLAQAIIKCLRDPATHARLSRGAFEVAQQFNMKNHLTALLEVFQRVTLQKKPSSFSVRSA